MLVRLAMSNDPWFVFTFHVAFKAKASNGPIELQLRRTFGSVRPDPLVNHTRTQRLSQLLDR